MSVLGIIPARGGSKRLPNKCRLALAGRPMIAHTCLAAPAVAALSALYVNTDNPELAAVAAEYGVECPELRPAHLATDGATTRDAILWMLNLLAARGEFYDTLVILQPTSPLRTRSDVAAALRLFHGRRPCSVVSVTPGPPRSWHGDVTADGRFLRWTAAEPLHRLNGAIYVYRMDEYIEDRASLPTYAYVMPAERGVDVDTQADFDLAASILEREGGRGGSGLAAVAAAGAP